MKVQALFSLIMVASAAAFAPTAGTGPRSLSRSSVQLEARKQSKRKLAVQTAKRVATTLGTVALVTSALPGAALAKKAKKTVEVSKVAKITTATTKLLSSPLVRNVGTFLAGALSVLILGNLFRPEDETATTAKIATAFPGSLKAKDLVDKVSGSLEKYGFGSDSLLATAFCSDEVNRNFEGDFEAVYGPSYNMGGLAGFPFAGLSGFSTMASHIPDGGSCLVVFGPHAGVDSAGKVGTVDSAAAALSYLESVKNGGEKTPMPNDPLDAQQTYVNNLLLPYSPRLEKASDVNVELPYAMYDAQKKMMGEIIKTKCGLVSGEGKIAVLGGIHTSTPAGTSDYFKPLSFEVYDNEGKLLEDLAYKL